MITVGIIEENHHYRLALLACLQKATDIAVAFAISSLSGLSASRKLSPDIVIIAVDLKQNAGTDEVTKIKKTLPDAKIIMLTSFEDEDTIFRSLKAGAMGYLIKKDPPTNVLDAIRRVNRGEGAISGVIARKMLTYFQGPYNTAPDFQHYNLTTREREVVLLLMDGLSYKEIAARCFVSIDTVNSHIRKIYKKLAVRSRGEITARFRLK